MCVVREMGLEATGIFVRFNKQFIYVCVCESHLSSKKYFFNLKIESKSIFIVCMSLETECIFLY